LNEAPDSLERRPTVAETETVARALANAQAMWRYGVLDEIVDVIPEVNQMNPADRILSSARALAAEQAKDEGLWLPPHTVSEMYLQHALRKLIAIIEQRLPEEKE